MIDPFSFVGLIFNNNFSKGFRTFSDLGAAPGTGKPSINSTFFLFKGNVYTYALSWKPVGKMTDTALKWHLILTVLIYLHILRSLEADEEKKPWYKKV